MKKNKKSSTHYKLLDLLFASPTEPMRASDRISYLTKMYQALHSLETSEQPTVEDWRLCTDAVNMMETLVLVMKVCLDEDGLIADAANGLAEAGKLSLDGKSPIRLSASGISAVRAVLQDYADCLESLPYRTVMLCHKRTEERMKMLLAGELKGTRVVSM